MFACKFEVCRNSKITNIAQKIVDTACLQQFSLCSNAERFGPATNILNSAKHCNDITRLAVHLE
jgi:hypothetical protein